MTGMDGMAMLEIVGERTLYGVFRSLAAYQGGKEWLRYERADGRVRSWTWSRFLDSVHQAVNLLHRRGLGRGDAVNLHLGNHPAYVQMILAASYLGGAVVPSNPTSSEDEHRYVVENSGAKLIVTGPAQLPAARVVASRCGVGEVLVCDTGEALPRGMQGRYEQALEAEEATPAVAMGASPGNVVQLLYTSGTTSRPKGVMLTDANFIYAAECFRAATGLRATDRHLVALPLFHAAAQCHALWPSLVAGASVAVLPRFSASRFFPQAVRHRATMAALFAAPIRMLLHQPPTDSDGRHRLRNVTYAQRLTERQCGHWRRRFHVPLQQLWGMTETCSLPVMSPLVGDRRLGAMGRPVLGHELRIVDELGGDCPPGKAGELLVRARPGYSVMLGYHNNPAATRKALVETPDGTWLHSGDLVFRDADGFIYFVDRMRDVIKTAGENVSSAEVEAVLTSMPGITDACVVAVPEPVRDEVVGAAVVADDPTLSEAAVQEFCAAHLAPFKVPRRVWFVEALPRTSVGKVRKHLVRSLLEGEPEAGGTWTG